MRVQVVTARTEQQRRVPRNSARRPAILMSFDRLAVFKLARW